MSLVILLSLSSTFRILNFVGREHWKESKGGESSLPCSNVSLPSSFSMWDNQLLEVASSTWHFLESDFPVSHHFGQGVWWYGTSPWTASQRILSAQHLSRLLCHPMGHAFKGVREGGGEGYTLLGLLLS